MKNRTDGNRRHKAEYSCRLLALLLCLCMVLSLFGGVITLPAAASAKKTDSAGTTVSSKETASEIKSRLMHQIRCNGWDPYSENMSLDEFYALMELFEEGQLPLHSNSASEAVAASKTPIAKAAAATLLSTSEENDEPLFIPREFFLFSGLNPVGKTDDQTGALIESLPGTDINGNNRGAPLDYDTNTGSTEEPEDYPAGLDNYNGGYTRPPALWEGVPVTKNEKTGALQAILTAGGKYENVSSISGDVDQDLFLAYNERYVRRVTVQGMEATILGAIKLSGTDNYVYYYLTDKNQSSDVSTTTLSANQKFIVEYLPIEHVVDYKVLVDSTDGLNGTDITDKTPAQTPDLTGEDTTVNVEGTDIAPGTTWKNIIFGTDRPNKTDGGAYAFNAYAPYGYVVEFYLQEGDAKPTLQMGRKAVEEDGQFYGGLYTAVNNGWALGMEPDYYNGTPIEGGAILPNTQTAPETLTTSGVFSNGNVTSNRTIIAVVHKSADPTFLVTPLKFNTDNVSNRGTSAYDKVRTDGGDLVPYDYEDVYKWSRGESSRYKYKEDDPTLSAEKKNLAVGNVATVDKWNWQSSAPYNDRVAMNKEADGTWSYRWTWQTNNDHNGYIMDSLSINGVSIMLPFYPKVSLRNDHKVGTNGGGTTWYTEANIGNGIHVKVELLMVFHPDGAQQRVYSISVSGARSNVSISAMNLMTGDGAAEFVAYDLIGITDRFGTASVEYYSDLNDWRTAPHGGIVVDDDKTKTGLNTNGDPQSYSANIRFKLADGYASPYYLWEATKDGVISGVGGKDDLQASIPRKDDGTVDYDLMRSVKSIDEISGTPESKYIYGPDNNGWYYIRISTQGDYKIALLTIVARPVRYILRYVPSYFSVNEPIREGSTVGIVPKPDDMPTFDHTDEDMSFWGDNANSIPRAQYDTKDGRYYDTWEDTFAILSPTYPTDPNTEKDGVTYRFVDWVLVDNDYNPIWAHWDDDGKAYIQVPTDSHGNRYLITSNEHADGGGHPALWDSDQQTLVVGSDYTVKWNSVSKQCDLYKNGAPVTEDSWVVLTRDGMLAYEGKNDPVTLPESADLTELLADWCVIDTDDEAVPIVQSSVLRYLGGSSITLRDVNQFAIANDSLGGPETDIFVLRLMPEWDPITNPFNYNVALNWVDAQGDLHEEFFSDYWNSVLTDWVITNGGLTVQIIQEATPFKDWIAMNPTYTFWDRVNNNNALFKSSQNNEGGEITDKDREAMREEMAVAIAEDIPALEYDEDKNSKYQLVLNALCRRDISGNDLGLPTPDDGIGNGKDDFWRLGAYAFQVFEDNGTIVIWMYEDKGGLVFHKDADPEAYIYNDQFYFTVDLVRVGEAGSLLSGNYKAYPERIGGKTITDADAWLVTFENGSITNIVKNDGLDHSDDPPVTHFTLRDGEGIELYIPAGRYTISEVGSMSGQLYQVELEYDGEKSQDEQDDKGWQLPEGDLRLHGSETTYYPPTGTIPDGVEQVSATVEFEIGEHDIVHTLHFHNITNALTIEKSVHRDEHEHSYDDYFQFSAELTLPSGMLPERDTDIATGKPYDFFYATRYNKDGTITQCRLTVEQPDITKPDEWVAKALLFPVLNAVDGDIIYWTNGIIPLTVGTVRSAADYRYFYSFFLDADGNEIPCRLVVTQASLTGPWEVQSFMLYDSDDALWHPSDFNKHTDGIWLADNERLSIIMTPVFSGISYVVEEIGLDVNEWSARDAQKGVLTAGTASLAKFINIPIDAPDIDMMPSGGGIGAIPFYIGGCALIFLSLAIALRNRKMRRRSY